MVDLLGGWGRTGTVRCGPSPPGSHSTLSPSLSKSVPVVVRPDQAQVGFVDQGGGVEGLAGGLAGELLGGQAAQLLVDQRQQLAGGVRVALVQGVQEPGDVAHDARVYSRAPRPASAKGLGKTGVRDGAPKMTTMTENPHGPEGEGHAPRQRSAAQLPPPAGPGR